MTAIIEVEIRIPVVALLVVVPSVIVATVAVVDRGHAAIVHQNGPVASGAMSTLAIGDG